MPPCPRLASTPQPQIRQRISNYVDKQLFPTALREVRADLSERNVLVGIVALGLILGLSGPFDTLRLLSFGPRVVYWLVVVVLTYAVGSVISSIADKLFRNKPFWLQITCSTIVMGTCITLILCALNSLFFGAFPKTAAALFTQWGFVTLISGVVEIGSKLIHAAPVAVTTPILDRIPFAKRGAIIALSAEDHYVNICTTQGSEMVLMRLSDAINEVGPTNGLQIHRSHWVALDQITDVRRINDRGEVTLSNGETRPISRSYMAAARDAGLLPKGRHNG
jgi:hypothetical protein